MRLIYMALLVLAGSYAPLLVIGALDPTANPIGPGLLAMLGTVVASLMVAWAALRAVVRAGR